MPSARDTVAANRQNERFGSTLRVRLEQGEGVVRNVSANGIYFVTDVALEEGAPLKFTLEFRALSSGPIQVNCAARVVRVEEELGGRSGVGATIESFEFIRLPLPGRSR
jgi:hypothetical protein